MHREKVLGEPHPVLVEPLTEREQAIVRLIADGLSNREIADVLSVALETVKWYNKGIYGKLGASSRTQAVARAQSLGLLNGEDAAHPPLAPPPKPHLPAQMTSFVGRQREMTEVKRLLENARLLTLTGPPGSGKTRLALQVALEAWAAFKDGAYFVPLAPVADGDSILWAIAEHIAFQFHPQGKPIDQLFTYLREKTLLLVLDNFEHLLYGAEVLLELLQAAPHLKMLVTSRERLNLYGEVNYAVGGLSLPTDGLTEDMLQTESVELFVRRARAVERNLDLSHETLRAAADICRLVEGLPLGIELAATWVDVLSPQDIADEIQRSLDILETDVKGAPNSIRAAFARSWDLLTEPQQVAFRRLAVFRGGFTRDAALAVSGVSLRILQALVNKSLLRFNPETGRYESHELLRQCAHERLDRSGEAAQVVERHADYFANFMDARWPQLRSHRQQNALLEIEADIENVRAAWHYWIKQRHLAKLKQFLHSLWLVYDVRGWYPAGIALFAAGVEVVREMETKEAQAMLGWFLAAQGYYSAAGGTANNDAILPPNWIAAQGFHSSIVGSAGARQGFALAEQGIDLLKQLDNQYADLMIIPLICLFIISCQIDEEGASLQAAHDCLRVATETDDQWGIAKAQQFLALKALEDGDYPTTESLAHQALSVFEASGDNWSKSVLCIEVLGLLAINLQQFETAKHWIRSGLSAAEAIGFKYSIQTAYWQLGFVAVLENNYAEAAGYWRSALGVAEHSLVGQSVIGFGGSKSSAAWGGRKLVQMKMQDG